MLSSQSKLKVRRKRRNKIVKIRSPNTVKSWFSLFKLDELLTRLRSYIFLLFYVLVLFHTPFYVYITQSHLYITQSFSYVKLSYVNDTIFYLSMYILHTFLLYSTLRIITFMLPPKSYSVFHNCRKAKSWLSNANSRNERCPAGTDRWTAPVTTHLLQMCRLLLFCFTAVLLCWCSNQLLSNTQVEKR